MVSIDMTGVKGHEAGAPDQRGSLAAKFERDGFVVPAVRHAASSP